MQNLKYSSMQVKCVKSLINFNHVKNNESFFSIMRLLIRKSQMYLKKHIIFPILQKYMFVLQDIQIL